MKSSFVFVLLEEQDYENLCRIILIAKDTAWVCIKNFQYSFQKLIFLF